jgi:formiminotetrahydrofolate cyclodeaminase
MAKGFEAVELEAEALGLKVVGSEIVGLVPRRALEAAAVHFLRIENFRPELVVENRLEQVVEQRSLSSPAAFPQKVGRTPAPELPLRAMVEEFVKTVAGPTPTPGGGSVAALAGALAAGLGEMVCGVSLKRKSFSAHHAVLESAQASLAALRERLMEIVDLDPQSYEGVMRAFKLPKSTEAEKHARDEAVETAGKQASVIPLEAAELAAAVLKEIAGLAGITIAQAASDLSVAANMAETARRGGIENVRANLPGVHDAVWLRDIEDRLEKLGP